MKCTLKTRPTSTSLSTLAARLGQVSLKLLAGFVLLSTLLHTACVSSDSANTGGILAALSEENTSSHGRPIDRVRTFPVDYNTDNFYNWNDRVFYQIFVRSFYDSNNDGIGDIRGIIEKLDYLNDANPDTTSDLGITGIWLMPIHPSPSYHGYDVTDYRNVHPDYGSLQDMRELIVEAERRGISVIIDLVLNHSSIEHPWFERALAGDAEYRNFYVWADVNAPANISSAEELEALILNRRGPWGQQVWHSARQVLERSELAPEDSTFYGLFWGRMPDLNFENARVTQEMRGVTRFWLEDIGVHGFRLDAVKFLVEEGEILENTASTYAWFNAYNEFYKGIAPGAFTVGEAWTGTAEAARYVENGLDLVFEFDLANAQFSAIRNESYRPLQQQQEKIFEHYPEAQYGRFLANHDQTRTASRLRGNIEENKLAAALLLTGPGVPFMYYGEEIGIEGNKPDENLRRPMHWTAEGGFSHTKPWQDYAANIDYINVEEQNADPASLLSRYRALIHLRNAEPALRRSVLVHLPSSNKAIYAYLLHSDEENLLVLHNLSAEAQQDYGLYLEKSPFARVEPELIYLGNSTGNYSGQELLSYLDLDSTALAQVQAETALTNESGGFANYSPLPELEARASYVFKMH